MVDLGTDIRLADSGDGLDLDPLFGLVSGRDALGQTLVCRLETRRGLLALIGDEANAGRDLTALCNANSVSTGAVAAAVASELEADERVKSAEATAAMSNGRVSVRATVDDGNGPFDLVLSATAVSVSVLEGL